MKDKPPVILQVLPALNTGGVERGTVDIAAAITRAGWTSLVASSGGLLQTKLTHLKTRHLTLPLASKNPLIIRKNAKALEAIIREHQVSLVHARSRAPAWSAYLAAQRAGVPFLTTFHGFYRHKSKLKRWYNSVMVRGERVIAVSNFVAEHIHTVYGVSPEKIRVIHRGVDIDAFSPERVATGRMAELIKEWHLPDDGLPIVMLPGRITRWKGQELTIRALASLPHRNFLCLLVGPTARHEGFASELEQLIRELKLEGRVRMVGGTDAMAEAYALSSLVLSPSLLPEAFGRIPAEAQAMGKPVIAARHGGACETIVDGQTGFMVAPGSMEELAQAIQYVLDLPQETKDQMGAAARQHIAEHFSLAKMQEETLAVYREILNIKL